MGRATGEGNVGRGFRKRAGGNMNRVRDNVVGLGERDYITRRLGSI